LVWANENDRWVSYVVLGKDDWNIANYIIWFLSLGGRGPLAHVPVQALSYNKVYSHYWNYITTNYQKYLEDKDRIEKQLKEQNPGLDPAAISELADLSYKRRLIEDWYLVKLSKTYPSEGFRGDANFYADCRAVAASFGAWSHALANPHTLDFDPEWYETAILPEGEYPVAGDWYLDKQMKEMEEAEREEAT
jgi:hypothetical protein